MEKMRQRDTVLYTQRVEIVESYGERRDCADQNIAKFISACGYLPVPLPNNRELSVQSFLCLRRSLYYRGCSGLWILSWDAGYFGLFRLQIRECREPCCNKAQVTRHVGGRRGKQLP